MEEADRESLQLSTIMFRYAISGNAGAQNSQEDNDVKETVSELRDIMGNDILPAFGATPYLTRLHKMLENPELIDESLNWAIENMTKSVTTHPDFLSGLVPSGVLKAGLEGVNRQALKGKSGMQSQCLGNFLGMYTCVSIRISSTCCS